MSELNELDRQAFMLADQHMTKIQESVEEAVAVLYENLGTFPDIDDEMAFRNTVGTMHMRSHLFAALVIMRGSDMPINVVRKYLDQAIKTVGSVQIEKVEGVRH